jgi:hypothetical protein
MLRKNGGKGKGQLSEGFYFTYRNELIWKMPQ